MQLAHKRCVLKNNMASIFTMEPYSMQKFDIAWRCKFLTAFEILSRTVQDRCMRFTLLVVYQLSAWQSIAKMFIE